MAPSMTLTTARSNDPLHHADPGPYRQRARRSEALRRRVIAGLALTIATLLVGAFFLVGQHLFTAWWLERHDGTVLWDIDETNWRQGGVTSVSFAARISWGPRLRDGDLDHFRRLHRVVSLDEGMRSLKAVKLGATRVTKEGIATLGLARPNLKIELDVDPAVEQEVKLNRGLIQ
jgi:hypothetical protein